MLQRRADLHVTCNYTQLCCFVQVPSINEALHNLAANKEQNVGSLASSTGAEGATGDRDQVSGTYRHLQQYKIEFAKYLRCSADEFLPWRYIVWLNCIQLKGKKRSSTVQQIYRSFNSITGSAALTQEKLHRSTAQHKHSTFETKSTPIIRKLEFII